MRKLLLTLAGVVMLCGQAAPPNTIVANYRAYQAALERGNLEAAETAAEAALNESVRRDGDGGRTGVLAMNLAQVRLARGRSEEAYAPALQAFTIASGGGAGVDPLLARLILGQSELTDARWRLGRERLVSALGEAAASTELLGAAYDASVALARRLLQEREYRDAASAWLAAADFSAAAPGNKTHARAEARLWQGASLFHQAVQAYRRGGSINRPRTGTRIVPDAEEGADAESSYIVADAALVEALELLWPDATTPSNEATAFSVAQRNFALALTYRSVMAAFLESTDQTRIARAFAGYTPQRAQLEPPPCSLANQIDPRPSFPPDAQDAFSVGAVTMRVILNERGETVDSRVAAAVPGRWFEEAVERVAPQWRFEALRENGCKVDGIRYFTIRFTLL